MFTSIPQFNVNPDNHKLIKIFCTSKTLVYFSHKKCMPKKKFVWDNMCEKYKHLIIMLKTLGMCVLSCQHARFDLPTL